MSTEKTVTSKNNNHSKNDSTTSSKGVQLRRLTIFSSGVGFFEHNGIAEGNDEINLMFDKEAVNDALKSIVINDPAANPSVSYHSTDTLLRTLRGLSIDIHENNHIAQLLNSLKGAEVEVFIPNPLKGRIMLVEYRQTPKSTSKMAETFDREAFLTLFTSEGVRIISLNEISGFSFCDDKINNDANRALDLIMQSRDKETRSLTVNLSGKSSRNISISYVIPMPIWKVSYRLDLSQENPFLQGWAIVDNDSDTDWEQVELALVTGRPVSFMQDLYAPYHLERPTQPLLIDGVAKTSLYETREHIMASSANDIKRNLQYIKCESTGQYPSQINSLCVGERADDDFDLCDESLIFSMQKGNVETTEGRSAGDQFEFTVKTLVSLARKQSIMLPLVEGTVHANRMLIFSGDKIATGKNSNPAIGVELINNTDMKLPAGAITVFDGGTYAGDSIIAFFPKEEKRIITYGEDLSVTGNIKKIVSKSIDTVSISNGQMKTQYKNIHTYTYTFWNASGETKRLIIEHPITSPSSTLVESPNLMETTSNLYRFEVSMPIGKSVFGVKEDVITTELVSLLSCADTIYTNYSINPEVRETTRNGLRRAIELKQVVSKYEDEIVELLNKSTHLNKEQERTRMNLAAASSGTQQGQKYLSRLAAQDDEIDKLNATLTDAEKARVEAKTVYENYINEMCFE